MRVARAADHWRHVNDKNNYGVSLVSLSYKNVGGLGTGTLTFAKGITVICGTNGAGKSTLCDALITAIDPSRLTASPEFVRKFGGSSLSVELTVNGAAQTFNTVFDSNAKTEDKHKRAFDLSWVDSAFTCSRILDFLNSEANFGEVLEQHEPRILSAKEVEEASYMVGKSYEMVEVYEIDEYESLSVFPYFLVSVAGAKYGNEAMGVGEFSIHYLAWQLKRASRNSVLLFNEPENYLSNIAQESFMNVLAATSVKKSVYMIISTHSPSIISRTPVSNIKIINRRGLKVMVTNNPTISYINTTLGIKEGFEGIIFVEDRAAKEVTRCWINRLAPDMLRRFDIVVAGSNGEIDKRIEKAPLANWLTFIGLFDADEKVRRNQSDVSLAFLPGDQIPELLFKATVMEDVELFANALHIEIERVEIVLAGLEGKNYHDWFECLVSSLEITYEHADFVIFGLWYASGDNANVARAALDRLLTLAAKK